MQCDDRWMAMATKRGNGEGSIYQRSQDGLWVASQTQTQTQRRQHEILGYKWEISGFIFTSDLGTAFEPRNMRREFKLICLAAGLGDWHPIPQDFPTLTYRRS
jgi:hypothetical protein